VDNLTPQQIVTELDKYIVGQASAKRAVAVALRNRYRRQQLPAELRRDVLPKNILMIGPTGVGKTEIARRVARILDAPFVKVEATRFTEAGYVGQDVETIVFDLVDSAIDMIYEQRLSQVRDKAEGLAKERLIAYLFQQLNHKQAPKRRANARRRGVHPDGALTAEPTAEPSAAPVEAAGARIAERAQVVTMLETAQLDDALVEIELSPSGYGFDGYLDLPGGYSDDGPDFDGAGPGYPVAPQKRVRRVTVKEARRLLARDEANKLVDFEEVVEEAVHRVEESGVVFIDEMDKIIGPRVEMGADVSGEGVQRDLLPIVEGATILTRYGPVKTDHILFVGAGAFYQHKPSDLIPELQGRFPIRVELESLTQADFRRILVDTNTSLLKQAQALLGTEGVELSFTDDAVDRLAEVAYQVNQSTENIGARRLQTVVERVLEELSFEATDRAGERVVVDAAYVQRRIGPLLGSDDLTRYIL
jgi:ATP-dependent HslUV protease ATP-binding subunit HslU